MNTVKPGWRTSEFWIAAGTHLVAALVIFGFVNSGDAVTLGDAWARGVTAMFALLTCSRTVAAYIKSRHTLKTNGSDNTDDAAADGVGPAPVPHTSTVKSVFGAQPSNN